MEDDVALSAALRFLLEVEGYEVRAFDSGEDLVGADLGGPTDCLVLDQLLGGMTGIEALERLRDRGVRAPAVLITTQLRKTVAARARAAGALVMEKPILGGRLVDVVREAVQRMHPATYVRNAPKLRAEGIRAPLEPCPQASPVPETNP